MLSTEFFDFCDNWIQKADGYSTNSLQECFDKFFTLFVVYNRLYVEATFLLHRKRKINILRRISFPDSDAAKSYVLKYLGSGHFISFLENDEAVTKAINDLKQILDKGHFYIKLHMVTGKRQRDKDVELLNRLRSNSRNTRAEAILDVLYSVRCNMFHGNKGFHEFQTVLLIPCILILNKVTKVLFEKLKTEI